MFSLFPRYFFFKQITNTKQGGQNFELSFVNDELPVYSTLEWIFLRQQGDT